VKLSVFCLESLEGENLRENTKDVKRNIKEEAKDVEAKNVKKQKYIIDLHNLLLFSQPK
jgi:hypothetical protein